MLCAVCAAAAAGVAYLMGCRQLGRPVRGRGRVGAARTETNDGVSCCCCFDTAKRCRSWLQAVSCICCEVDAEGVPAAVLGTAPVTKPPRHMQLSRCFLCPAHVLHQLLVCSARAHTPAAAAAISDSVSSCHQQLYNCLQ